MTHVKMLDSKVTNQLLGQTYKVVTSPTFSGSIGLAESNYLQIATPEYKMSPSVRSFLASYKELSMENIEHLLRSIFSFYGYVHLDIDIYTDAEEGWSKPIIKIHSGIDDYDHLLNIEEKFFFNATKDPILSIILPLVILSQA